MGAIWWGTWGMCPPNFFKWWGYNMTFFLFRFCIWRGLKNKSDICHVFCEELLLLDGIHSQVHVETEFGVVSLFLLFYKF